MAATPENKPRLLVTRKLPDAVERRAQGSYRARLNPEDRPMSGAELVAAAGEADALLVTSMDKLRADVIAELPPSIVMIATVSVGYDHLDVPAARARGIAASNTPGVLTDATAEIAMLLLLGAARGASWGEKMVRTDSWTGVSLVHPLGLDVTGRRPGILGMGRIGQALARRARGFDMDIHYHNRQRLDPDAEAGATFHASLDDMLPLCDFISINCASTPETRGIVDAEFLAKLPTGAVLVNAARGDIVDEDALFLALASGRLAAVGLDVYRNEPKIDPRFRALPNAFLLPHLGSATLGTRTAMGMRALDNVDAFFAGRTPRDLLL